MEPEFSCKVCNRLLFKKQVYKSSDQYPNYNVSQGDTLCSWCKSSLRKNAFPPLDFILNNLNAGDIPQVLQDLSLAEKRCISKINTFFTLLILPAFPVGQLGMKGLVVHLPLPVFEVAHNLPRYCASSNVAIIVPSSLSKPSVINPTKVFKALRWLCANNSLYSDISLDWYDSSQNSCYNSINMDQFQFQDFGTVNLNTTMPDISISNFLSQQPYMLPLAQNFTNLTKIANGEELAFPTLFPYGKSGFTYPRHKKLTLLQYYKAKLYNIDKRWRSDISYLLSSVGSFERNRLFELISV